MVYSVEKFPLRSGESVFKSRLKLVQFGREEQTDLF